MAEANNNTSQASRRRSSNKTNPSKFEPCLYNFHVSAQVLESMVIMKLKHFQVVAPDFSCLLDHAMATLWYIFANDGAKMMDLTKTDITWTLRFLESLDQSSLLESAKDINSLIQYLRAILSVRYSMEDETQYENQLESILNSMEDSLNTSQISEDYINALAKKQESGELEIELEWKEPVQKDQAQNISLQVTDEAGNVKKLDISDMAWQDVCNMLEKKGENTIFHELFQAHQRGDLASSNRKPALVTSTPKPLIDMEIPVTADPLNAEISEPSIHSSNGPSLTTVPKNPMNKTSGESSAGEKTGEDETPKKVKKSFMKKLKTKK